MRAFTALALGSLVLLAGCVTPPDSTLSAATDLDDLPLDTRGVLHRADGVLASAVDAVVATGAQFHHGRAAPEPTIGATPDGAIWMTGMSKGGTRGGPTVLRTLDKGQTWEEKGPKLPDGTPLPPSTNDPYVHVDPDTGRVFMLDLHALVCSTLSWTDNGGDAWVTNPVGCGHPVGAHDHQTMVTAKPRQLPTVGYPKVVYYCVNRVVDSACATSLNGGLSFGPLVPAYTSAGGFCGGLTGHVKAAPDGTVYLARDLCGKVAIAKSVDDGLRWTVHTISDAHAPDDHDVEVAIDEAGNVYAFWQHEGHVWLSRSTDQAESWSEPVDVTAPGVTATAFNAIAAGKPGHVALAYIGTTIEGGYEGKPLGTGGLVGQVLGEPDPEEWAEATWNAYVAVITDALADDFVIQTVTANDPADPIARGLCGGTRCHGMTDFIDVIVDPEGRPWASFVDVCTRDCVTDPEVRWDAAIGFAGTLLTGPALRGDSPALPAIAPPPGQGAS